MTGLFTIKNRGGLGEEANSEIAGGVAVVMTINEGFEGVIGSSFPCLVELDELGEGIDAESMGEVVEIAVTEDTKSDMFAALEDGVDGHGGGAIAASRDDEVAVLKEPGKGSGIFINASLLDLVFADEVAFKLAGGVENITLNMSVMRGMGAINDNDSLHSLIKIRNKPLEGEIHDGVGDEANDDFKDATAGIGGLSFVGARSGIFDATDN